MKKTFLRKKVAVLLVMVLVLGLVSGTSPVRVQATGAAAGVQAAGRGVTARSAHAHDMSVECGNDASLDYIPLTGDADGKLYIDGTEASINTSSTRQGDYILPEGNYYLADNITVHKGVFIESGKTVKLCLNGKTLQIQTEDGNGLWIGDEGNFYLSDCESEGRITAGSNVLQSSIDSKFIMYGGCLECTMAGGNVIYLGNSGASAEIYGGAIKSDRGIGIASGERTQCEFSLSGNPVFVGNMVDVNSYVTLQLNALDRNRNERIKVSRDTELSVGESQALDSIRSLDGVDYSTVLTGREGQYFTYKNDNYFVNRAGVTRQPTPEEVSVDVLPAEGAAYQWYEAAEQDVTADRTIENMSAGSMSATIFTLQAGDTLYFTLPETPIISEEMGGDAVMLYSTEQDIIPVTSLGNRRYKGTVESDITFMVNYVTESSDLNVALFEEGTYEVKAVTQGDAVVGQTTDTFTKVESGTYLCEITWEDLGCDVTSDLVEVTVTDEDKVAAVKAVVEEVLADYTATNGSTREEIQGKINTALSSAGIVGVTVTVGDLTVMKATKGEEGSISGSIGIQCGSETDSVAVNKTIAQLPTTDADKVAAAKKIVEETLAGYTATNGTTKQEVQEKIDTALTNAGISDVTVTVGDLNKTEATTGAAGSVSGSVSITKGSASDSVAISKTIAKLPATDAAKVAAAKAVVEEVLADYMATNGSTSEEIQNKINTALSSAGITDVTVTVGDLAVKKATESEAGSISGSIAIECGSESDSVAVNKTIGKLPTSDAAKVAAAKAVVEEVLADYTATNDSTSEEIQNKINTALSSAGITGVTVTVGDLAVKKATESEEGSISGSIAIECGSESDSVTVNKLIAKAEVPDKPEVPEAPGVSEAPEMPGNTVPLAVSQKEQEKNALSLNAKLKVSQTGKKINIAWGRVPGAEGYDVYVQYCGKKFTDKSVTAVESGKTTKVTVMKVDGKPLNLKKNYKIYVLAYKLVNDKKVTLGKTVTAHIIGRKNTKYTNVKAVKVQNSSYLLKKGKTAKIKASTVLVSPGKKQLTNAHAKQFRYASTNKKVATVSVNGKIKAVGKGNCIIYVYARNGYAKKIKVMVK